MNAAGFIIFISVMICLFVKIISDRVTLKRIRNFLGILFMIVGIFSFSYASISSFSSSLITKSTSPAYQKVSYYIYGAWGLYTGLNYETSGYFSKDDYNTWNKVLEFDNKEEAQIYQKRLLKDRVEEYLSDPIKIPKLFFKKIHGLFTAPYLPFGYDVGNSVNDFILHGVGGIIYSSILFLSYICQIICLFIVLVSQLRINRNNKNDKNDKVILGLHCKMVIIGAAVVFLFTEAMNKYVSHTHILLFIIMMLQIKDFLEIRSQCRNRLV